MKKKKPSNADKVFSDEYVLLDNLNLNKERNVSVDVKGKKLCIVLCEQLQGQ